MSRSRTSIGQHWHALPRHSLYRGASCSVISCTNCQNYGQRPAMLWLIRFPEESDVCISLEVWKQWYKVQRKLKVFKRGSIAICYTKMYQPSTVHMYPDRTQFCQTLSGTWFRQLDLRDGPRCIVLVTLLLSFLHHNYPTHQITSPYLRWTGTFTKPLR